MSLFRLCRQALPHAAAVLLTASLVASCETAIGSAPQTTQAVAEASPERVILQTYRLIGDRHLNEPDFRKISVETYRGFAGADVLGASVVRTLPHGSEDVLASGIFLSDSL